MNFILKYDTKYEDQSTGEGLIPCATKEDAIAIAWQFQNGDFGGIICHNFRLNDIPLTKEDIEAPF
jgi:hypothetical protein